MKYYLLIIGCQMNVSDAERLARLLDACGGQRTADEQSADVIIVVSCSVRQKAIDRIYGRIKKWRQRRKGKNLKTVLTGCVLPSDRKKLAKDFDIFLEIKNMENLPRLLGLKNKFQKHGQVTNADYLALPPNYSSSFQAYVPIMTGCNNYCAFCAVPYTRGQEASRPSSEIIKEVASLVRKGYKEITLLGQNVNAYIDPEKYHSQQLIKTRSPDFWQFKKDQPIQWRSATTKVPKDFAGLLKKISALPGDFWIRFFTSNPQDVSDELIKTLPQCQKVTPFFHLPIQSGDNEILRRMNRRHTREYYLALIKKIRKAWPQVAISTDIIVGFPGETVKHFLKTADLMKKVKFDMAYLAEYSPRLGTAAARFFPDNVPKKEKVRRKKYLNNILEKTSLKNNKKLIGQTVRVLVENFNPKTKVNTGKTAGFKDIRFIGQDLTGQFVQVKIIKANAWNLSGQLAEKQNRPNQSLGYRRLFPKKSTKPMQRIRAKVS